MLRGKQTKETLNSIWASFIDACQFSQVQSSTKHLQIHLSKPKNHSNTKTHHICLVKFDKHPKSSLNISTCSGWEVPSCVPKVWNNKKTLGFSQTTWIPWASRCCWHSEHLVCHNASGSWKWARQPNHYKHRTHNTQITTCCLYIYCIKHIDFFWHWHILKLYTKVAFYFHPSNLLGQAHSWARYS